LDEWIIMPDHLHGILIFQGRPENSKTSGHLAPQSLGAAVGKFKSDASKRIWWNLRHRDFAWQDRFHDTIVRDSTALENLRAYIRENPKRWTESKRPGLNSKWPEPGL
jgi:REP element-mobilizing transposase RayT